VVLTLQKVFAADEDGISKMMRDPEFKDDREASIRRLDVEWERARLAVPFVTAECLSLPVPSCTCNSHAARACTAEQLAVVRATHTERA
jgi:hypothetical protein